MTPPQPGASASIECALLGDHAIVVSDPDLGKKALGEPPSPADEPDRQRVRQLCRGAAKPSSFIILVFRQQNLRTSTGRRRQIGPGCRGQ
jgi:hypothetical protein